MRSFVSWVEDEKAGFILPRVWDPEKGALVFDPTPMKLFPHQRKIFDHVLKIDPNTGKFPYRTVIYSCPKKSGKTALGAAIGAWYADESYPGTEIYVLANDREQAQGRMMKAIQFDAERKNKLLFESGFEDDENPLSRQSVAEINKWDIKFSNGTFIQTLSSHYTSAAGGQQALTLWDELWGYQTEKTQRLWEEMTLIPTEQLGLRVVVTYAGFEGESHLLWELYRSTVIEGIRLKKTFPDLPCYTNRLGTMFVYWDHEPRMPWQTADYYEAEMAELRPVQYRRLHLNEWGNAEDEFIPIELWDNATELEAPLIYTPDADARNYPISIGVDVGVKRDTSAVVGVWSHRKDNNIELGLAFHRIWIPGKSRPVNPEHVEAFIREMYKMFKVAAIVVDATHFHQNIMTMQADGMPVNEFTQSVGNMVAASTALYESLRFKRLKVYPDEEMRSHIQFAAAKVHGPGFRIVKKEENARPVDASIALAMAVHDAIQRGGIDTTKEIVIRSPFSDVTAYAHPDDIATEFGEENLPEALRPTTFKDRREALRKARGG